MYLSAAEKKENKLNNRIIKKDRSDAVFFYEFFWNLGNTAVRVFTPVHQFLIPIPQFQIPQAFTLFLSKIGGFEINSFRTAAIGYHQKTGLPDTGE